MVGDREFSQAFLLLSNQHISGRIYIKYSKHDCAEAEIFLNS
jgi:hypothetical protein